MGNDKGKHIYITDFDLERLKKLVSDARAKSKRDIKHLRQLEAELNRAVVVVSKDIPPNIVTMNSKIALQDVDTGEKMVLTLTFPSEASMEDHKISILAPIGTAVIGCRKGDVIEWEVPAGTRHLKVEDIVYQPESAGDFHL